jgi:hypothetical protein
MRKILIAIFAFGLGSQAFGATIEMNGNELGEMFGLAIACEDGAMVVKVSHMIDQWLDENGRDLKDRIMKEAAKSNDELVRMGDKKRVAYCTYLKTN